jgi:O-antigen/teichoic acid export membrane protein/O-antigen ligase
VGRPGDWLGPLRESARWSSLRGNRLARATAGTLFTAAAGQFFLLLSGPLVARLLGVEDRGNFAWLNAWVAIVVIVGHFGTPWACGYYVSRNPKQTRQILGIARGLLLVQSVVLTFVLWLILGVVVADEPELTLAIVPTLLLVPAALLHLYAISFLQAQQRFLAFNVARTAPVALYAFVIAVMFAAGQDRLVWVMTAWTACHAVVAVAAAVVLLRHIAEEDEREPGQLRRILSYAIRGSVATTSPLDQFPLDQLVIGFFLSPVSLGLWVVASAFRNLPMFVGQSVGMVAFPASAAIAEARAGWRLIWRFLGVVTILMIPLSVVLFLAMPTLVHFFFGAEFAEASSIARILIVGAFFASLRQVLLDGLRGTGNPGFATLAELSMYPWLLLSTPILIWQLGADGVAVALAVAFAICFAVAFVGAVQLTRHANREDETAPAPHFRFPRPEGIGLGRAAAIAGLVALSLLAGAGVAKVGTGMSSFAFAGTLVLAGVAVVWLSSPNRIFWLLAAAVATTPFTTIRALGAVGNVSDALFMLVLLALLVRASIRPQLARQLFVLGPRALPLVIIAVAGILASMNAVSSKESLLVLAKIIFTFWMLPNIIAVQSGSADRIRILIWAYVVGASIASLGAMADMLLGTGLESAVNPEGAHGQGRYAGPTGHPNLLGLVAATGVSGAVGLYLTRARGGTGALVAAAICSIGIFASASLTAVAAVCGGVAAAFFLAGRRAALRRGTVLVGVFVATMFLFGKVGSDGGQVLLLSRLEGDILGQESVEEREQINDWAIAQIRESPFVGHGLDQVGTGPTHSQELPIIHNLWIQTWYIGGILAVVGFALLYFTFWRMRVDVPRPLLVPLAAMTVPWLASMISQTDVYARWGLFGFLAIVAASMLRAQAPAPQPEPVAPLRPLPGSSG